MAYSRINFKNGAEGGTPLSAANMNHIEDGIVDLETTVNILSQNITNLTNNKQDQLTAGNNINIANDGTISAVIPDIPNETVDLTFTFSDSSTETISFVIESGD